MFLPTCALLVSGALLGGCSSDSKSDSTSGTTPPAASTTALPTTPLSTPAVVSTSVPIPTLTPSTSPEPTTSSAEANGTNFGYVKAVDSEKTPPTLTVDYAQLLTGEAADKAAQEDGVIGPGEHIENDYYIRNQNRRLRTFGIASTASVKLLPRQPDGGIDSTETVPRDIPFFLAIYSDDKPPGYEGDVTQIAYNVTLKGGVVTAIDEVFFP
jgi:hypothetical protein